MKLQKDTCKHKCTKCFSETRDTNLSIKVTEKDEIKTDDYDSIVETMTLNLKSLLKQTQIDPSKVAIEEFEAAYTK
jgi:hypothetical protein